MLESIGSGQLLADKSIAELHGQLGPGLDSGKGPEELAGLIHVACSGVAAISLQRAMIPACEAELLRHLCAAAAHQIKISKDDGIAFGDVTPEQIGGPHIPMAQAHAVQHAQSLEQASAHCFESLYTEQRYVNHSSGAATGTSTARLTRQSKGHKTHLFIRGRGTLQIGAEQVHADVHLFTGGNQQHRWEAVPVIPEVERSLEGGHVCAIDLEVRNQALGLPLFHEPASQDS